MAAPDAGPVEALAPISLGGRDEASFFFQEQGRRSSDRGDGDRLPQSPLLRFQTPTETFASVLDFQRVAESESIAGITAVPGRPAFSGLVNRAISLYETTAQFLSGDDKPRGDTINNSI